jgi:hypothetical protein
MAYSSHFSRSYDSALVPAAAPNIYNPYHPKRPNSSSALPLPSYNQLQHVKQMAQIAQIEAYMKSQNMDVNKSTSLPSFMEHSSSGPSRQSAPVPKPLFSLSKKDSLASTSLRGGALATASAERLDAALPRAASARKSVRFSNDLVIPQSLIHAPQDASALPLVSVLKTSGKVDINANPDANVILKPRNATSTASLAPTVTVVTSSRKLIASIPGPAVVSGFQVSGDLPTSTTTASNEVKKTIPAPVVAQKKLVRPSLSDQLAAIGANASALTQDIRAKAGLDKAGAGDPPLLTFPAKCFIVGTLSCRYPSPVSFYQDRMEYTFHHPFENSEIRMLMYYRDLIGPVVVGNKLRYKLPRSLTHFPADFDPNNPQHQITVEFTSSGATTSVKQRIFPLMTPSVLMGTR